MGASFSGGHVLRVAADRDDIAAVIALTPLTSGFAVSRAAVSSQRPRTVVKSMRQTLAGVKSRIAVGRGGAPTLMPLVSPVGEAGALELDGAYESYLALAGPTWRNEIDSSVGLEVVGVRTTTAAKRLRCPLLVQIADFDQYVPADAVAATARHGRVQVRHNPCDHSTCGRAMTGSTRRPRIRRRSWNERCALSSGLSPGRSKSRSP